MARMFLVDGSYEAFRRHFALPPRHTSDGFPTRVLYGFTLLFQKVLNTWKPDYIAVAFDTSHNFRLDLYEDYKGHRPEMPEDLSQQWPHLSELVEAFGFTALTMDGYEADDILGTLATTHAGEDCEIYLVTADKDYYQLIDDDRGIMVLDEMKSRTVDADGCEDKFGVGPDKVIDSLALAGDSSDNVPGVQGIGIKTAAKLLDKYGTLEGILKAAADGEIGGKRGQRLVEQADAARLSKKLVTIERQVPLDLSLEDLAPKGLQVDRIRELFDQWEFGSVARKLLPDQERVDYAEHTVADTASDASDAVAALRAGTFTTVDFHYDDPEALVPTILGVALAGPGQPAVYIPLSGATRMPLLGVLGDGAVPKVVRRAKTAYRAMSALEATLAGVTGDTRILDYILTPHRRTHNLADQAKRHLAQTPSKPESLVTDDDPEGLRAAAAESARLAAEVHAKLDDRLTDGQRHVYEALELPLIPILARMELVGIRLDTEALKSVEDDIAARLDEVEKECHELAGKAFNVRSRHELRDVLFEELGLTPSKRVKDGWSTASSVLEKILDEHPLPGKVLEYRSLDKLRSTYLRKLPGFVSEHDGRIHTSLNQAVAATGRLSSNDPNLQNIPVRTFEGRRIRQCFVPAEGHVFLSADYSQVELRVLAHFTKDPVLLDGFARGEDIHRRTAVEIFGADPDDVTIDQRSAAKAINFGLLYGMSAFRLARDLDISREEAQGHMDRYFERMPSVRDWIDKTQDDCREHGWVETLYGRRRVIPEIHSAQHSDRRAGEREAVNTRIQGTAADLIKMAMIAVDEALSDAGLGARMILQVHDELLFEVPEDEVDALTELVKARMEGIADLEVPLSVTTAVGSTWNDAHG